MSKGKNDKKTFTLFPDLIEQDEEKAKIVRYERNIAEYPITCLDKRENLFIYEIQINENTTWTLVGNQSPDNPEFNVPIPNISDLDYYYALIAILFDQTDLQTNTIYFTIGELLRKAGKKKSKEEYTRALNAIRKFRWLTIRSHLFQIFDKATQKTKIAEEDISLIQHFGIIGSGLKPGKKKAVDPTRDGWCEVIFSDHLMNNLKSRELSRALNFSFLMSLSSSKARRMYTMLDVWREQELHGNRAGTFEKSLFDIAVRLPTKSRVPSEIRSIIDPVHEELREANYLQNYSYRTASGMPYVQYAFSPYSVEQNDVLGELLQKGIGRIVADNIVAQQAPEFISAVLKYCEIQKSKKDISPGYIVTTMQNANYEDIKRFLDNHFKSLKTASDESSKERKLKSLYDAHISELIEEHIAGLSTTDLDAIRQQAERSIGKDRHGILSASAIEKALEGAMQIIVKEKIKLPTFKEWFQEEE